MKNKLKPILLIDDDPLSLIILKTYFESFIENPLFTAKSIEKGLRRLQKTKNIELIITDFMLDNEKNAFELLEKLEDVNHNVIIISADKYEEILEFKHDPLIEKKYLKKENFLQKPISKNKIVELIEKIMLDSIYLIHPDYKRVHLIELLLYHSSVFPVYLKLQNEKYLKIINEDGNHLEEILNKYLNRGLEYVYLKNNDYEIYLKDFLEKSKMEFNKNSNKDTDDIQFEYLTIENIHQSLKIMGVGGHIIEATDSLISSIHNSVKKNPKIYEVLKTLEGDEGYIYKHALLTSYFSIAIENKMDWSNSSNHKKLSMAAMFKDMALNDDHFASIVSTDSEDYKDLNEIDLDTIKEHPKKAVQIIQNIPDITADTLKLITEHHERPNGYGFPKNLNESQISPLSAIFILSNHLAHMLILKPFNKHDLDHLLGIIKNDYTHGHYLKAYLALEKIIKGRNDQ